MKKINLYKSLRAVVTSLMKVLYHPEIEGNFDIPADERIILAGNHVHFLDAFLLASVTKRQIYFLSKKELFKGPVKAILNGLGCIPVDRSGNGFESIKQATDLLNQEACIGIFPEGTRNKTDEIILPFKLGTIMIAKRGKSDILPFAITGKYKLFRNDLQLKFGERIRIKETPASEALGILEDSVKKLILKK